jgi:hypothetical protein
MALFKKFWQVRHCKADVLYFCAVLEPLIADKNFNMQVTGQVIDDFTFGIVVENLFAEPSRKNFYALLLQT